MRQCDQAVSVTPLVGKLAGGHLRIGFGDALRDGARCEGLGRGEERLVVEGPSIMSSGAANLAARAALHVYPVTGWWRYRKHLNRCESVLCYSLGITIETSPEMPETYTPTRQLMWSLLQHRHGRNRAITGIPLIHPQDDRRDYTSNG